MATAMSLDKVLWYHGHTSHQLRVEIARGTLDDKQIRRRFGLTTVQLSKFVDENADAIAEIGAALHSNGGLSTAGLWIAKKEMRISEMQSDVNDINDIIGRARDEEGRIDFIFGSSMAYKRLIDAKTILIRSVADEIDGTRRAVITPEDERKSVRYVIGGDDDITGALQ